VAVLWFGKKREKKRGWQIFARERGANPKSVSFFAHGRLAILSGKGGTKEGLLPKEKSCSSTRGFSNAN